MKKIIAGAFLTILWSATGIFAQAPEVKSEINKEKINAAEPLPAEIRTAVEQIRIPQPDLPNRMAAMNNRTPAQTFTLTPENLKEPNKGQIDINGAPFICASDSSYTPCFDKSAFALINKSTDRNLPGKLTLTIANNAQGAQYFVDLASYVNNLTITASAQVVILTLTGPSQSPNSTPNSQGHHYFLLTADSNDDVIVAISSPNANWAFHSVYITKLN